MRLFSLFFIIMIFCSYGQRADFADIDFKKADSTALYFKGASLKNLPLLTHNLTAHLTTDVEKFRSIYTWVCTNIENDYSSYLRTSKKRKKIAKNRDGFLEWNVAYTPKVFEKLLKDKRTACTGYSYLIRELAHLAGLKCELVDGYGRTPTLNLREDGAANHSWNAVFLNNQWYLSDATWSAGRFLMEKEGPTFQADYFDGYFLAAPALFAKNHYPLNLRWLLLDKPPSFPEFLNAPIVYKEAFKHGIVPILPYKMKITIPKNETINFSLKTHESELIAQVDLQITSGSYKQIFSPVTTINEGDTLTFTHSFPKTGSYDVHITINNDIVATYVVVVKGAKK